MAAAERFQQMASMPHARRSLSLILSLLLLSPVPFDSYSCCWQDWKGIPLFMGYYKICEHSAQPVSRWECKRGIASSSSSAFCFCLLAPKEA